MTDIDPTRRELAANKSVFRPRGRLLVIMAVVVFAMLVWFALAHMTQ